MYFLSKNLKKKYLNTLRPLSIRCVKFPTILILIVVYGTMIYRPQIDDRGTTRLSYS